MAEDETPTAPRLVEIVEEDEEIEAPGLCVPMYTKGGGTRSGA
jgi:hypothetical protein